MEEFYSSFLFPSIQKVKLNETKPVERNEFREVDRRQRRFRFTISVESAGFNCFSAEFSEKYDPKDRGRTLIFYRLLAKRKKNCFFGYFNFNGKTLKALKLRSGLCKFGITFSQEITYILRHLYIYFYPETTYEQLISFQLFIYKIININKMLIFMSRSLYLYHLYLIRI